MANEFIIKNGYRSQGNSEVTGSAIISGSLVITGSLITYDPTNNNRVLSTSARTVWGANTSESIDWDRKRLYSTDGQPSVFWNNRILYDVNMSSSISWGSRILTDASAISSVDWNTRILTGTDGKPSIRWQDRTMHDISGKTSVDWTNRIAYDSAVSQSINWGSRTLLDTATSQSVDWNNRKTYDKFTSQSIDWDTRVLRKLDGTIILNWNTAQFTGTASFATQALSASWAPAGGGSPGGSDTYVQFNNAGAFGGEQYFTYSTGSRSIAQGNANSAIGTYSHAEGQSTLASGSYSHAEGESTVAQGLASHAEGGSTTAAGYASHAEGYYTVAQGQFSHAEGSSSTTGNAGGYYAAMTASGVFAIDPNYGDVSTAGLFDAGYIIGVDDSQYDNSYNYANLVVASCSFNGTNTIVHVTDTTFYTSTAIIGSISNFDNNGKRAWGGYGAHAQGDSTTALGAFSHAEGESGAYGLYSHAEGGGTTYGNYSHAEGTGIAYGTYSHAEGKGIAYGTYSHAEGFGASGWIGYRISASIALGVIKLEPIYGDQTPDFAANGFVLIRDPDGEIVAGVPNTYRYQISSSAFTSSLTQITLYDTSVTTATTKPTIGIYGNPNPIASDVECGLYSHAAGVDTATLGDRSDASGHNTRTLGWYQSVVGQFNQPIAQPSAFIVGDGVDDATRHNLLVAASGSVVISGSLILTPTASGAPTSPGTDGQIIFGQAGGNYKIYVWLGGAWRSGSLS